ncbi:hypothetical protein [Rathayibacter sp. VKM Ac-2760]|uniref:hypothetical protein n=1 Tax=Rathayibacter sp. VKM Ac-2760 TaxID=2609253 RepID=UPI0013199535|nr:hypothetical protein [Rathayibacter sp. VKM Ac-2760]QHC57373.1 hypothetical protein GSU72_01350 [Rathayibacter sp. VKM Ac-2760]
MSPTSPPSSAEGPLRRRSIVAAAAWTVPTVVAAVSAPLASASTTPVDPGPPSLRSESGFEAVRCDVVPAGTVLFRAFDGTNPATKGGSVTVSLPSGLVFTAGGVSTVVAIGDGGAVSVPALRATGAAGAYTVTAVYGTAVESAQGTVTATPGQVVEITRSPGAGNQPPRFSTTAVTGVTDGFHGAISGDEIAGSAGRNAAILTTDGRVRYWGADFGAPVTAPGTLTSGTTPVTGMTFVDTWTCVLSGNTSAGGIAAGTRADSVFVWARTSGAGALVVLTATGISGTVLAAESNDGHSYVLTTTGLHWWANATSGDRVAATLIAGTAGATTISTWGYRRSDRLLFGGGVLLAGGAVSFWNGSHTLTASAGTPADIVDFRAGPSAAYAITGAGELWTQGVAYTPSTGGAAWTRRAEGVAAVDAWSVEGYTGGVYITAANEVLQFFAAQPGGSAFRTEGKAFPPGIGVTKVFSTDGTSLALASNATVFAWGGNLDNSGRTQPALVAGVANATDLNAWGFHGSSYTGGGYIISATTC